MRRLRGGGLGSELGERAFLAFDEPALGQIGSLEMVAAPLRIANALCPGLGGPVSRDEVRYPGELAPE